MIPLSDAANNFEIKYRLLVNRAFKLLGITKYFETAYGIKAYNKRKLEIRDVNLSGYVVLSPGEVLLGFDALKDDYTLLGTKISDSPHFDLIKRMSAGERIDDCEYIVREQRGYLDGRFCTSLNEERRFELFNRTENRLSSGQYDAPTVYVSEGKYYAADGKHRLATALLLNMDIRCRVADTGFLANDRYTADLLNKMVLSKGLYEKNVAFIESLLGKRV